MIIHTCKICGKECHVESGYILRHLKKEHNINSKEVYYYMFNNKDKCIICKDKNKTITNWNFDKLETCDNKDCRETNRRSKISKAQKLLYKNGKGVFQQKHIIEKNKLKLKLLLSNGLHPFQHKDVIDAGRERTSIRNRINNPMWKDEAKLKSSKSHKNKKLSEVHKQNISLGLSKYLFNLSDEDFKIRMDHTQKCKLNHCKMLSKPLVISEIDYFIFDNPAISEQFTINVLNNGQNFQYEHHLGIK